MKHPNPDMLLHIAIGDAYCLALEYVDWHDNHDELLGLCRYLPHPTHGLPAGSYSDDTQMSIAVAEALIECGIDELRRPEAWVERFLRAFKRDPRDGYARGFQHFLERTDTVEDFLANIRSDSDKNGAAMRSVPLGVIQDVSTMLALAETQAAVTHNTAWGIMSSQAVALMSHYTLYATYEGGDLSGLTEYVCDHLPTVARDTLSQPWEGRVQGPQVGRNTAHAVLSILRTTKTMREVILRTLLYKGDTDSVGAIALGIAGASHWHDLPQFMEYALEPKNKAFAADFLKGLGRMLVARFDQLYSGF